MDELRFAGLQRQLKNLYLREGNVVRVKGSRKLGKVIHIEKDFNKINWQGAKAFFVVVLFDDGSQVMAAPIQLKRVGKQ